MGARPVSDRATVLKFRLSSASASLIEVVYVHQC